MLVLAWLLLSACLAVHLSTFVGFDPIDRVPGVMFLHLAVMALAFLSFFLLRARTPRGLKAVEETSMWRASPRWMRRACVCAFVYAIINFGLFMLLSEGGGPQRHGSAFTLESHGKTIRTISEAEFHRQQAYVARGFSGHWIMFTVAFVTFWTGAARSQRGEIPPPIVPPPAVSADEAERAREELDRQHVTSGRALGCVMLWLTAAAVVVAGTAAMSVPFAPVLTAVGIASLRRQMLRGRAGRADGMETGLGCLTTIPSALLGFVIAQRTMSTIVVAAYAGVGAVLTNTVTVGDSTKHLLSNGTIVDGRVWAGVVNLGGFLLWALTASGMIGLMEAAGRYRRARAYRA
jgi:hypothetical protein